MALPTRFAKFTFYTECDEDIDSVIKNLSEIGCCTQCILRFLGEKCPSVFTCPLQELKDSIYGHRVKMEDNGMANDILDNADTDSAIDSEGVCITCLGILQKFCESEFTDKICSEVSDQSYQYDNFICSIMLPVAMMVRDHAIWVLLRQNFPEVYKDVKQEECTTVKDVWKWINGPILVQKLHAPFAQKSPFEIYINFLHDEIKHECNFLSTLYPETYRKRKTKKNIWEMYTRMNVLKSLSETSDKAFKQLSQIIPKKVASECVCESIKCTHAALYMAGRYNKYSRTLSQTPWLIEGARKQESSVEELITKDLKSRVKPTDVKFSASGREDVDVRMLGNGRPFVVEFINPHIVRFSQEELGKIQKVINTSTTEIAVRDLQVINREDTVNLKEGEIRKTKTYSALCWSDKVVTKDMIDKIGTIKDLILEQATPIRVLHRRSQAIRRRTVYSMSATLVDKHHFKLCISTQAGTYIKEFVHGDFGRTQPNLGSILDGDCDILELDVESVELDWPPKIVYS